MGGISAPLPLSESCSLSPIFLPLLFAGSLPLWTSGLRSPQEIFPLPLGGPSNTSRQLSLTAESPLRAFSTTCDIQRTRFLFSSRSWPPSRTALLSMKEGSPHVGLCESEPRASDSPAPEPRVAAGASLGRCPCRSPSREAPTRSRAAVRSRTLGAPPTRASYLALVHLSQVPEDVQAGRGEMRPHGARTHHGGICGGRGSPRAPGVTAAEHQPGPLPPTPVLQAM